MYLQNINLFTGWNSLSSYLVPLDPDVENIFEPYADNLIIIKNLTSLYWPYSGVNTIGDWDNGSGYAIKVSNDIQLQMAGLSLAPSTLTLSPGWHYIPVLSECPVSVDEIFAPFSDKITLVQDIIGTQVWWPDMGVFTLQTLIPGKSYKIRLEESITLAFPLCGTKSITHDLNSNNEPPLQWGSLVLTPSSHTVLFMKSSLENLSKGDMIGAFNSSGALCGFMELGNTAENQAMILFGDDISTPQADGFGDGEHLLFRIIPAKSNEEMELNAFYADDAMQSGNFESNGISIISALTIKSLSSGNAHPSADHVIIYPNPSNGVFHVAGTGESAVIEVFNAFGKVIYHDQMFESGVLQLSDQPGGIYYIRIENDTNVHFEKLIIQ